MLTYDTSAVLKRFRKKKEYNEKYYFSVYLT